MAELHCIVLWQPAASSRGCFPQSDVLIKGAAQLLGSAQSLVAMQWFSNGKTPGLTRMQQQAQHVADVLLTYSSKHQPGFLKIFYMSTSLNGNKISIWRARKMSSDLMLKVRHFPWDPDCKHCFIVLMLRLAQLLLRSSSTAVVSINLRLYTSYTKVF